ncbi:MAG: 3-hydroxyacyl-ACP dehydratase FabZ [Abditibacteriales bacterium]|nr:3-hydroxyacyl-ACP dehydratase FabZ [Abditibacteriales bacterium]MDW8366294.1 3-hydroxyacyl-ACP dehydratase FabZ [Abditibacteriales bacterium]
MTVKPVDAPPDRAGALTVEEIQRIIPHRRPFLLIDGILVHEPGRRTVGLKNVTANEALLAGQHPHDLVMPPLLIVECLAQTGAVLLLAQEQNRNKEVLLVGLDDVKFSGVARAGDQILCEAIALNQKGNIGRMKGTATVNGTVIVEGMYWFALNEWKA